MLVYAIIDVRSSPDHPLGDAVETFVRREDAERFVAEVRGDDPELASSRSSSASWRPAGLKLVVVALELVAQFYSAGPSAGTSTALNRAPRHETESTPSLLISSSRPNERT